MACLPPIIGLIIRPGISIVLVFAGSYNNFNSNNSDFY